MWSLSRVAVRPLLMVDATVPCVLPCDAVAFCAMQAGGGSGALEVKVPAGITRLFKHPVMDWALNSLTQKQLTDKEVRRGGRRARSLLCS